MLLKRRSGVFVCKIVIQLLIIFFVKASVTAQQDKMFTQYLNYPSALNPAYVGSRDAMQFFGVTRKQWVGIDGAPESTAFSVNSPIHIYNLGIGINMESDRLGPEKSRQIDVDLSYRLYISEDIMLNLGLKSGFSNYRVNLMEAKVLDMGDSWLQNEIRGEWIPNFGVGAYLHTNRFFLGVSIPRLLNNNLKDAQENLTVIQRGKLHYYIMGGGVFNLNPIVKIKPSCLFRMTRGARLSYDLSGMVILYDRLWLGTSYRNEDAVAAILQYNLNYQLRVGYAYDFGVSRLSGLSNGSHEITLSYDLELGARKLKSPRYF